MTLADFGFARPGWLLALLPLAFLLWRIRRAPDAAAAWRQAVDAHLLPHLLEGGAADGRRGGLALLALGALLVVLALAGPRLDNREGGGQRPDRTRVLVVDLSDEAREATARRKVLALLRVLPAGQTALLVYAGEPYLLVPPSTDAATIALFVPELAADALPVPGNRPEEALAMAGQVLARSGSSALDLIWIAGDAEAPEAAPAGVRLSILHSGPDSRTLADLAAGSGGAYVRMQADDSDVARLAGTLDGGAWTADGTGMGDLGLGPWLLLPLLPLAALAFRRGLLALLLALPLAAGGLWPGPAEAADGSGPQWLADYRAWRQLIAGDGDAAAAGFADRRWQAVAHYRAGRFRQAAALWSGAGDADSLYNLGNALARQGSLAAALGAYEAALGLRPADADIRHNRDLVRRLLNDEGGRGKPPPPGSTRPQDKEGGAGEPEREAARLAEQWLRRLPDEPGSLLRRKLLAEHRRRLAGEAPRPW